MHLKQKRLILLAAAVAVMMMACEPDKVVTPEPAPSGPTYLTSLVGTMWNYHEDYWMSLSGYGDMHIVSDTDISFLTDSTGTRRTYSDGAENFPAGDYTFGIYYQYDSLTRMGLIEDSGSMSIQDFRYDAAQDAILLISSSDTSNYKVYTRVQ